MQKPLTAEYIEGIKEGREWLKRHGKADAGAILDNLERTARTFDAQSPVG